MDISDNFIQNWNNQFKSLSDYLRKLLREEKLLENDYLVKKGFLIKRYSIKFNAINKNNLLNLKSRIKKRKPS